MLVVRNNNLWGKNEAIKLRFHMRTSSPVLGWNIKEVPDVYKDERCENEHRFGTKTLCTATKHGAAFPLLVCTWSSSQLAGDISFPLQVLLY